MTDTYQQIETLFSAALDREDADERRRFLHEACGGDEALRERVESLVNSLDAAGDFLEEPAATWFPSDADDAADFLRMPGSVPAADQVALATPSNVDGETQAFSQPDHFPRDLSYLEPPTQPGALGRLGGYEILETIGVGGMGVVLKAQDTALKRVVAIKVLGPLLALDPKARQRFQREAQAAAAVSHPHVVSIHAVQEAAGLPYLVMEYIEGGTLQEKLQREGRLGVKDIVRIGLQAALGLAAAHQRGLIHRDIKPGNILLEDGDLVKITDFGLAHAADDVPLTQTGAVAGTPQFMSPEQAEGLPVSPQSDLFSFGVVLYATCTGQSPFRAPNVPATLRAVCDSPARPVHEANPDIPAWLAQLIMRLLAKDPAERYPSAIAVAEELRARWLELRQGDTSTAAERCTGDCGACQWGLMQQADRSSATSVAAALRPDSPPSAEVDTVAAARRAAPKRRMRWAIAAGVAVAAAFLVWAGIILLRTSDGEYILETDDPQIAARLGADGGIVVHDLRTDRTYTLRRGANRLPSGDYELEVTTPDGLELSTRQFQLKRGGRVAASVRAIKRAAPAATTRQPDFAQSPKLGSPVAAIAPFDAPQARREQWTSPENLGLPLSTTGTEWGPHLTADGLSLLFTSDQDRHASSGPLRLWRASRPSPDESFGEAVKIELPFNEEEVNLTDPTLSADSLVLAFCCNRPQGSVGEHDLWLSTRPSGDAPWSAPVNAGPGVNSDRDEFEPELSSDGLSLFFHSNRGEGEGGTDLWMSRRSDRDEPFGTAVNLGAAVNGPTNEGGAALSPDGLTLLFHRVAGDDGTLWQARRPAIDQPFVPAVPFPLRTPPGARGPCLSTDGRELFLAALSSTQRQSMDLWRSHRVTTNVETHAIDPRRKPGIPTANPK